MKRKIVGYRYMGKNYPTYDDALHACAPGYRPGAKGSRKAKTRCDNQITIVWDEPKKSKFWKIVGWIIAIVTIVANIIGFLVTLPAIIANITTVVIPTIARQIKALGGTIINKLLPQQGLLRKAVDGVSSAYENWVKPTLTAVKNTVDTIHDKIYKVYNLTIGGITKTYNDLFGWVDGVRTTINEMLDKTSGLVAVVDKKAAERIQGLKTDFNRTMDKLFVDWFDKVLVKINEVAGPILTRVDEVKAVFDSKIDNVTNTIDRVEKVTTGLETHALTQEDEDEVKIMNVTKESEQATEHTMVIYSEFEEAKPPKKTRFELWIERYTAWLLDLGADIMDETRATIDTTVEEIAKELYEFKSSPIEELLKLPESEYGEDVLKWAYGELTLGQLIRKHWRQILFNATEASSCQEARDHLLDNIKQLEDSGVSEERIGRIVQREIRRINRRFPNCIRVEEYTKE